MEEDQILSIQAIMNLESQTENNPSSMQGSTESVTKAKRKRTSHLWDYYTKKSVGNVIMMQCVNCAQVCSVHTSKPTLTRHAETHGHFFHIIKQYILSSYGSVQVAGKKPKKDMHEELTKRLVRWITANNLTFTIVESREFKTIMNFVDWDYEVLIKKKFKKSSCSA